MSEIAPIWAVKRAQELTGYVTPGDMINTFARYIAEHEDAPVDPVMEIFHSITRDEEAMDRHFQDGFIEALRRLMGRDMIKATKGGEG